MDGAGGEKLPYKFDGWDRQKSLKEPLKGTRDVAQPKKVPILSKKLFQSADFFWFYTLKGINITLTQEPGHYRFKHPCGTSPPRATRERVHSRN